MTDQKNNAKNNILKGLNKKIRQKNVVVAIVSIAACLLVITTTYFMLFVKQVPLSPDDFMNVRVDTKIQTINQISDDELPYNQLKMNVVTPDRLSFYATQKFYLEKNTDEETASIYFYMSQTHMQRVEAEKESKRISKEQGERHREEIANITVEGMEGANWIALVSPELFHTDLKTALLEVTKVYYLVYDYDDFDQSSFDKIKSDAVLLWEK